MLTLPSPDNQSRGVEGRGQEPTGRSVDQRGEALLTAGYLGLAWTAQALPLRIAKLSFLGSITRFTVPAIVP